jgi:glutamine amidotransferase
MKKEEYAVVVDYGMGNLRSIQKSLIRYYNDIIITNKKEEIELADALILPGVGSFGDAMKELKRLNLIQVLKEKIEKTPTLGICLGMQLLFEKSEESPEIAGLEIIKGDVKALKTEKSVRIPHTGWNRILSPHNSNLSGYVYFNHTYYCEPDDKNIIISYTIHGKRIPVIIKHNNIFATQFHPEKSKGAGEKIISYFVNNSNKGERN